MRRAARSDLPMLGAWGAMPHDALWWGGDALAEGEDLDDTRLRLWIVRWQGRDIAFIQDYDPHAWPNHHFAHLPPGARRIDLAIGPADRLGLGHGPAFLRQHLRSLFAEGAPVVATDPHPDNARARRACARAGFTGAGPACDMAWGVSLPMLAWRETGAAGG